MKISRRHGMGWGLLFALLTTSVNGMQVSARVAVPTTEYSNVSFKELVSVYERAYDAQKFHVHANTRETMPEGNQVARLVLDMANPAHGTRKKAQLSFLFHSPGKGACTPCSVSREMFSVGEHEEYTGEEWDAFQGQLFAADKRALDEIKRALGARVTPLTGRWDQGLFVGNGAPGLFSACLAPGAPSTYGLREAIDLAWNGQDWIESKGHVTTGSWHVRTGVRDASPSVWRTGAPPSVATPIDLRKLYLAKQPVLDCGHWLPGPRDDFLREASATPPLIATSVAAGFQLSCAILDDGTPRCWGDVGSGSVGLDTGGTVASILVHHAGQIALNSRACALRTDGSVACWGGRAGGGDAAHPATVDAPAKATAVSLGSELCAILADGSVACSNKQPGTPVRLVPVPGIKDAISISAGSNGRSCVVTRRGDVECWGRLAPPPVLNEDEDSIRVAATRIEGMDRTIAVASGRVQDCALLGTGKVACWSYDSKSHVLPAPALPLEQVSALSSGGSRTCALAASGEVYCWDDPYTANHGNATAIAQVKGLKDAMMISVGAGHACALVRGGSVRCWGRNTAAQLGVLHDLMQPGQAADGGMTAHMVFGFAGEESPSP